MFILTSCFHFFSATSLSKSSVQLWILYLLAHLFNFYDHHHLEVSLFFNFKIPCFYLYFRSVLLTGLSFGKHVSSVYAVHFVLSLLRVRVDWFGVLIEELLDSLFTFCMSFTNELLF